MTGSPTISAFFDEPTNTVSYLVADPATKCAAVIDPVLDYDQKSSEVDTRSVAAVLTTAQNAGYKIEWTLETHAHADHLSGSPYVKAKTGARIGIGEHIKDVQRIFRPIFNATDLKTDGSDFDYLFADGEHFRIGELDVGVIYTPGHTPACVTYKIGEVAFVGDTLFMPILARLAPTSPVGMRANSIVRFASSYRFRHIPGSICAMTTKRRAARPMRGRRRSQTSARRTCM